MSSSGSDSKLAENTLDSVFGTHSHTRQVDFHDLIDAVLPLEGNDTNLDQEVCAKLLSDRLVQEGLEKGIWLIKEIECLSVPHLVFSEKQAFDKAIPALINDILKCCLSIREGRTPSIQAWANDDIATESFLIASHVSEFYSPSGSIIEYCIES
jgi:hypothetical protein